MACTVVSALFVFKKNIYTAHNMQCKHRNRFISLFKQDEIWLNSRYPSETQQKIVWLPIKWVTTNTSTLHSITRRKPDPHFPKSKETPIALPDYETNGIQLGSQSERKLSTQSQTIQQERKPRFSSLSVDKTQKPISPSVQNSVIQEHQDEDSYFPTD